MPRATMPSKTQIQTLSDLTCRLNKGNSFFITNIAAIFLPRLLHEARRLHWREQPMSVFPDR
jgi:hypothetical protein